MEEKGDVAARSRGGRAPGRGRERSGQRDHEEHEPDDAKLCERLEVEAVCVADEDRSRLRLEPRQLERPRPPAGE